MSSSAECEISHFVDMRYSDKEGYSFKVKWKNYDGRHNSWVSLSDIQTDRLRELVENLMVQKRSTKAIVVQFLKSTEFHEAIESTRDTMERALNHHLTSPESLSNRFELTPSSKGIKIRRNFRGTKESNMLFDKLDNKCKLSKFDIKSKKESKAKRNLIKRNLYNTACVVRDFSHYKSEEFNFLCARAKKLLVTNENIVTVDPKFLNLEINTIISNDTWIQGLQKLWGEASNSCYRVAFIHNNRKFIRTIDSIYLDHHKFAFEHLKKKLCQLWLINEYCRGLVDRTTEL